MAYRPPHARRSVPSLPSSHQPASSSLSTPSTSYRQASQRSSRPINQTSFSTLQAPSSDIKPNRRFENIKPLDEMELLQSVSRSGGDGAEGDALKDGNVQERYRRYIEGRLDKHYDTFKTPRHAPPPTTSSEELASLGSIVLLFRKLREGVVASHRVDDFAIEVFEASARISILAKNTAQLLSSLGGLIPGLYTTLDKGKSNVLQNNNLEDRIQDLRIDDKDSRVEMVSLLLLFHVVHTDSRWTYYDTLLDLTQPVRRILRSPFGDSPTGQQLSTPELPFIQTTQLSTVLRAARCLSPETLNPIAYFALLKDPSIGQYEKTIILWARWTVEDVAWKMLEKAYLESPAAWVVDVCGLKENKVEGWVMARGRIVIEGRVKLR